MTILAPYSVCHELNKVENRCCSLYNDAVRALDIIASNNFNDNK
jgi:hypothetical protein